MPKMMLRPAVLAALLGLTLSACRLFTPAAPPATALPPEVLTASAPPAQVTVPVQPATLAPTVARLTPAAPDASAASADQATLELDLGGVAQSFTLETVAAVPPGEEHPGWEVLPEHRIVSLQGYPITGHRFQPQIFIFPVAELSQTVGAPQVAADLSTILRAQAQGVPPSEGALPFLPPLNAAQVMTTRVQGLAFQQGTGLRYLTQFAQAPVPINNFDLLYTFQGLSADGRTYVAAVLPVQSSLLPADDRVTGQEPLAFGEDFPFYVASTAAALQAQPDSAFTPDLAALDALIASLVVR